WPSRCGGQDTRAGTEARGLREDGPRCWHAGQGPRRWRRSYGVRGERARVRGAGNPIDVSVAGARAVSRWAHRRALLRPDNVGPQMTHRRSIRAYPIWAAIIFAPVL